MLFSKLHCARIQRSTGFFLLSLLLMSPSSNVTFFCCRLLKSSSFLWRLLMMSPSPDVVFFRNLLLLMSPSFDGAFFWCRLPLMPSSDVIFFWCRLLLMPSSSDVAFFWCRLGPGVLWSRHWCSNVKVLHVCRIESHFSGIFNLLLRISEHQQHFLKF